MQLASPPVRQKPVEAKWLQVRPRGINTAAQVVVVVAQVLRMSSPAQVVVEVAQVEVDGGTVVVAIRQELTTRQVL